MGMLGRLRQLIAQEGIRCVSRRFFRYLGNCRNYLVYEPVVSLEDAPIDPAFDKGKVRIAVQIHMFYPELTQEMIDYTNRIPYCFDCYISTDSNEKAKQLRDAFERASRAEKVEVAVYPNRGRDIAPFLWQLEPHILEYDYCCHLHSKRSKHGDFGNRWRRYLLDTLLASPEYIAAIFRRLETDPKLGLIFQRTYPPLKPYLGWRGNRQAAEQLFLRMGLMLPKHSRPVFPAGDMFWARTTAIQPVFECKLTEDDFPRENAQVEQTLAHCLERCWGCLAEAKSYGYIRIRQRSLF